MQGLMQHLFKLRPLPGSWGFNYLQLTEAGDGTNANLKSLDDTD